MSKTLSPKDLQHLARLANLPLDKDQALKLLAELNQILDYVSQLQQVDTTKVDPTAEVTGLTNVFQSDSDRVCLAQKDALDQAPKSKDGYVVVKGVFEESSDV